MKLRILSLAVMLMALPFLCGCFGVNDSNPVAPSVLSAGAAAPNGAATTPSMMSSNAQSRKFSYAEPAHSVTYQPLDRCHGGGLGQLRIHLVSAASADHIYINVTEMRVKPASGKQWVTINVPDQEIDLKNAAQVSQVLASVNLAQGVYQYMRFKIQSARVVWGGQSYNLVIPSRYVNFVGRFEIKAGYMTELKIQLFNKIIKTEGSGIFAGLTGAWMFCPVVKISATLVPITPTPDPDPVVTTGDVAGLISHYVSKVPLSGVTVALSGTAFSATTGADGTFSMATVPAGDYILTLAHPEFLNKSFPLKVVAGQAANVTAEMNPAVIKSTVANTGWFSQFYPAEANGTYIETKVETPVAIDFVSLSFTKVEVAFDMEYSQPMPDYASVIGYMAVQQQVVKSSDLGSWWAGWNGTMGTTVGYFQGTNPPTHYVTDITEFVRNNPSNLFFSAFYNQSIYNARVQNIQMTIYYR